MESIIKPPLGLIPKLLHDERRKKEIYEAIHRYIHADKEPPKEWFTELNNL